MSDIRQMRMEDFEALCRVDVQAFGSWLEQLKGSAAKLPQRTHANILACREKDPEGCFVIEVKGELVGSIFSRTWGKVGWFGPFSVQPEFQGCGYGKQLIAASIDYLRSSGVRVVGLETMPESPRNLGLYLKMGFRSRLLTFLLTKSLDNSVVETELPCWSSADPQTQARWLDGLRDVSMRISPGYDYSKEIRSTARHDQGDTLVLASGTSLIGMSVVLLKSQRRGVGDERAIVQVLTMHPAHTSLNGFRTLLSESEALAKSHGKQVLTIPINARHNWALQKLLEWGYQVEGAMVRMTLAGMDEEPLVDELVNCSRWAG